MPNDAPPDTGSKWPKVAVGSSHMTGRGERIKKQRNLLRMSQMDLHKATGVGLRTIGRIEAGENENSPSVEVLEDHLGISDWSVSTEAVEPRRTADEPAGDEAPPTTIEHFTLTELLIEAVRRVTQFEARTGERLTGLEPPRRVKWPTAGAPSARRTRQDRDRPDRGTSEAQ